MVTGFPITVPHIKHSVFNFATAKAGEAANLEIPQKPDYHCQLQSFKLN